MRRASACVVLAFLTALPLTQAARAEERRGAPLIPRQDLFGNPEKSHLEISPDGKWIAWLAPLNGVMNIFAASSRDLDAGIPITHEELRSIRNYYWTYDGVHLVYPQDDGGDESWHIHAANVETRETKDLTPFTNKNVRAVLSGKSRKNRHEILISLNERDQKFPDLFKVDLESGDLKLVRENSGYSRIIADASFTPRVALRNTADGGAEILRATDNGFEPLFKISPEDAANTKIEGLSGNGKSLLMLDSRGRDTAALTRVDLATNRTDIIAEDPKADISNELADWNSQEPAAYTVTYQRTEHVVLSAKYQADFDFLTQRFGSEWAVTSRTDDDNFWTVTVSGDLHPAVSYLYRRDDRTFVKVFEGRSKIDGARLAPMYPEIVRSRDGLDLVSYLTLPKGSGTGQRDRPDTPLPMVLLVHGGPWSRDTFGYRIWHQWLANRGYAVLSVNFRGSSGFGKAFSNAGDREWGGKMDDDLIDAAAWAVREKIADPDRIAVMGASYGGYATLASMARNPDTYACGVDLVGPSELESFVKKLPSWNTLRPRFVKALGDPGTEEGRKLLRERSPYHKADRIRKPILIAHGDNDPRVKKEQSDKIAGALRKNGVPVTYVVYRGEGHGFAEPENNISFAAVAESFLANCLGGRAAPLEPSDFAGASIDIPFGDEYIQGYSAVRSSRPIRNKPATWERF